MLSTLSIFSRQYLNSSARSLPRIVSQLTKRTIPSAWPVKSSFCAGIIIISASSKWLSSAFKSSSFISGFSLNTRSEMIARLPQIRTFPPSRLMSEKVGLIPFALHTSHTSERDASYFSLFFKYEGSYLN